jgi:hypothetical protein
VGPDRRDPFVGGVTRSRSGSSRLTAVWPSPSAPYPHVVLPSRVHSAGPGWIGGESTASNLRQEVPADEEAAKDEDRIRAGVGVGTLWALALESGHVLRKLSPRPWRCPGSDSHPHVLEGMRLTTRPRKSANVSWWLRAVDRTIARKASMTSTTRDLFRRLPLSSLVFRYWLKGRRASTTGFQPGGRPARCTSSSCP